MPGELEGVQNPDPHSIPLWILMLGQETDPIGQKLQPVLGTPCLMNARAH